MQAISYGSHLLKKGWHFEPWDKKIRWPTYIQQAAFTTSLIISYSRPFTESRGWPKFPKKLIQHNEEQKALHKKIMNLRNEVYAHSDFNKQEVRPIKILGQATAIIRQPSIKLSKEEVTMLLNMSSQTIKSIDIRLSGLINEI